MHSMAGCCPIGVKPKDCLRFAWLPLWQQGAVRALGLAECAKDLGNSVVAEGRLRGGNSCRAAKAHDEAR